MPSRYGRPSEGSVGPGWEMGSSRQPVSIAEVGAVRDTGFGSGSQRRRLLCAGWVPSAHPLHLRWTVRDGFTTVEVSWNSVSLGPHGEQVLPAGDQRAWLHEAQLGARLSGNHEDVEATCGRLRSQTDSFWQRLMPILGRERACAFVEPLPKIGMMFAVDCFCRTVACMQGGLQLCAAVA